MSEINAVIFNNVGAFRQAITFISGVCPSVDTRVRLHTRTDEIGLTWVDFTTENGVSISVDAMTSSECWECDACVFAKDMCIACDRMQAEPTVTMFIADGKLFIAGFYNEKIEGYELECGLRLQDMSTFNPPETVKPTTHIDIDQIACATVVDSLYQFDFLEIIRKNGVISYRCGDEHVVLATVMQSENTAQDDVPDFGIRIPAEIFRAIPMVAISNMCSIDIDTSNHRIRVVSSEISMVCDYTDAILETTTSAGMTDFCTMDSMAIAATIDTLFKVNYTDPTGMAEIVGDEDGAMRITVSNSRIELSLTVGEVKMHDECECKEISIPLDVLTMMIRNTKCKLLTLKASADGKTLMMCYTNGLYARKCTYIAD